MLGGFKSKLKIENLCAEGRIEIGGGGGRRKNVAIERDI